MPIGIACPACQAQVGYNGRCTQCGAQAFESLPGWERLLMAILVAFIIAANCAAAPFCLIFALAFGLCQLWLARKRGIAPDGNGQPSFTPRCTAPTDPPASGTGPALRPRFSDAECRVSPPR